MFVPEYETKKMRHFLDGELMKVTYVDMSSSIRDYYHITYKSGKVDVATVQLLMQYNLITLLCPYCQSTLNQGERIECEKCGCILKAVDDEMLQFFLQKQQNWLEHNAVPITCGYPEFPKFHHINGIHFLEIAGGNKDES